VSLQALEALRRRQERHPEAFNREISDFVNRVRHHIKVEHYAFDVIDDKGLRELIYLPDDVGPKSAT